MFLSMHLVFQMLEMLLLFTGLMKVNFEKVLLSLHIYLSYISCQLFL